MEDEQWHDPVRVITDKGDLQEVSSADEAAHVLVSRWRGPWGSNKHVKAQAACLDAIEGKCSPDHARTAFEDAAREAGILAD